MTQEEKIESLRAQLAAKEEEIELLSHLAGAEQVDAAVKRAKAAEAKLADQIALTEELRGRKQDYKALAEKYRVAGLKLAMTSRIACEELGPTSAFVDLSAQITDFCVLLGMNHPTATEARTALTTTEPGEKDSK